MLDHRVRSEVIFLVRRLVDLAERVGLKAWEIESLIAVRRGIWPF